MPNKRVIFLSTGSILEHFDVRNVPHVNCDRYMKPGVNFTEAGIRMHSRCGCDPERGEPCRDLEEGPSCTGPCQCKPTASADCKQAVQEFDDSWVDDPDKIDDDPNHFHCAMVRIITYMMASSCKN